MWTQNKILMQELRDMAVSDEFVEFDKRFDAIVLDNKANEIVLPKDICLKIAEMTMFVKDNIKHDSKLSEYIKDNKERRAAKEGRERDVEFEDMQDGSAWGRSLQEQEEFEAAGGGGGGGGGMVRSSTPAARRGRPPKTKGAGAGAEVV